MSRSRIAFSPAWWPLARAIASTMALCFGLISCDVGEGGAGQPERLSPFRVNSDEAGDDAWALFDRDAQTKLLAESETKVELTFGEVRSVQAVKVFGTAPYALRLLDADGEGIGGEIDLREGDEGAWNLHPLPEAVSLAGVTLELRAYDGPGEVGDIELWATGPGRPIAYAPGVTAEAAAERPAHVDLVRATPEALTLGPEGERELCGAFRFELPRHPGAYRRMWLRASIAGVYRPFALTRALNEHSMIRAHWVPSETSRSYVQPIDPELLFLGANEVHYCVPADAEAEVTIDGVEIVGELDHGSNFIESATVAPYDAMPTRSAAEILAAEPTAVRLAAGEELVLAFDRLVSLDGVLLDAAQPAEWKVRCVDESAGTHDVAVEVPAEEAPDAPPGVLRVTSGGERCAGVRVSHQGGGVIDGIHLFGSGAARRIDFPQIVLASAREHFGHEAWVEGWARAPSSVGGGALLTIEGVSGPSPEGMYGRMLARSSAPADAWVVTVSARFADGSESSREFVLDGASGALPGSGGLDQLYDDGLTELEREARYGTEGQTATRRFGSGQAGRVALGTHASIDIPEGAVQGQADIAMAQLAREDIPALDPGMINVTAPFARGYEFSPHGQTFAKAVTITLPYQENLLPAGYTGHDVETFFFNEELGRWETLARAEVDFRNCTVQSLSDHFTTMINAVVVTPEHPQISSFDGNRISGLEAANPAAGIATIAPPEPNNRGDAVLSYPLAVPPGRLGMQPELALTYNSSGGNGWLGTGWDLGVSTISVDTRLGVPRYRPTEESETYLLDGQQLSPEANRRGPFATRSAGDKEFRPRVEGGFQRIVRRGTSPKNYRWEVTNRTGVTYFYGALSGATSVDPEATLADDEGNIFRWALREIRDAHDNLVRFDYDVARLPGDDGLEGRELYLRAIHYTLGSASDSGVYQVHFCTAAGRPDPIISGRGGFKQVMDRLLGRIEVHHSEDGSVVACDAGQVATQVRAWRFQYGRDPFGKTQLRAMTQEGAGRAPAPWNTHTFEYFDEVRTDEDGEYAGFGTSAGVTIPGRAPDPGFSLARVLAGAFTGADMSPDVSALGGNVTRGAGMHFYVGFNASQPRKQLSFGGKIGASFSQSEGLAALIDIDGDDLPDRVFCERRVCRYNRNLTAVNGHLSFADESAPISGLDGIFRDRSFDFSAGPEVHVLQGSLYTNQAFSFTRTVRYLSDVNADGFVDVVDGSNVLYNRIADGAVRFESSSSGTHVPMGVTTENVQADLDALMAEYESQTGPVDTLRLWQAQWDGTVRIRGTVAPIEATAAGDGFDAAIERVVLGNGHYASERLWAAGFEAGDAGSMAHDVELGVSRGDFVVFRLHSRSDGAGDRASWDPTIEYTTDAAVLEENGLEARRFTASDDFVLAGREASIEVPYEGVLHVSGSLRKLAQTSDEVRLEVLRDEVVATTVSLEPDEAGLATLDVDIEVEAEQKIRVRVATDSPIDLRQLVFEAAPRATYTSATDAAGDPLPVVDARGEPILAEDLPFDMSTYNFGLRTGRGAFVPTETRTLDVRGIVLGSYGSGPFIVTAKSEGRLLAKARVPNLTSFSMSVPVEQDEEVFFTVNGLKTGDVPLFASVYYVTDAGDTAPLPWRDYVVVPSSHLPRPYRGWTYAAYKPGEGGFDAPVDGDILFGEGDFDEDDRVDEDGEEDADAGVADGGVGDEPPPSFEGSREDRRPWMRAVAQPEPCEVPDPQTDPDGSAFADANPLACEHPEEPYWVGPEDAIFVTATGMGTSRLGPDTSAVFASAEGSSGAGRGTIRISRGTNRAVGGGVSVLGIGVADSNGYGVQDFLDMNGDGFPDVVTRDDVAYSMPHGGLGQTLGFGAGGDLRGSRGRMITIGAGASIPRSKQNGSGTQGVAPTRSAEGSQSTRAEPTFGFSLNGAGGSSETREELLDVNGDGLPDRVSVQGSEDDRRIMVRLNLGYRFAPEAVEWSGAAGGVHVSSTWEVSGGINIGELFTHSWGKKDLSFGGGVTATGTRSAVRPPVDTDASLVFEDGSTLLDVNGDGLVDAVQPADDALAVRFNRGGSFGPRVLFSGLSGEQRVEASETFASSAGGSFTLSIGPLCVVTCYLIINPGLNGSNSVSRPTVAVRDVDGDGLADVVTSSAPNGMSYSRNRTGKTGLLRKVTRPLGASFALDYARAGNTQAMPRGRWVLSRVKIYDGVADSEELGAKTDYQLTRISYADGRYERFEREFLGFATVTVEDMNTSGWSGGAEGELTVYRRTTQRYLNGALYERGLLAETGLESGAGALYRRIVNTYEFLDPSTADEIPEADRATAQSVFPALVAVDEYQHEGDDLEFVSRHTEQEYDKYGNVTTFRDAGGLGAEDDLTATIEYSSDQGACRTEHVVSVPRHITVVDHSGRILRERSATVACPSPLVTSVDVTTSSGVTSTTSLVYDTMGRLEKVTYPPNAREQAYTLTYAYDQVIGAHVTSITDAFGYVSTADYDFRYGAPESEVDINGREVSTVYDVHGRAVSVTGPYEQGSGVATITYAYHPEAAPAWATTSHHDVGGPDRIETYSFVDGLGRALQTKKDGTIHVGDETPGGRDVMIVSGRVLYDPWGRVMSTWHPTTEALGSGGVFHHDEQEDENASVDPTRMTYDVLDRVRTTTVPASTRTEPAGAAAVTSQTFSLVAAGDGLGLWAETEVVDAMGQVREARRDARGRIREVIEHGHSDGSGGTTSATTRYVYDPLDQLVMVKDARGNETRVQYDLAGRRTHIDSPDAGLTELIYDPAGNVIERITAALRGRGPGIKYAYDFAHLVQVDHPGSEPDIEYTWGAKDAPAGQRGRITRVLDAAGTVEREYGPLGEVVRETRQLYRRNQTALTLAELYPSDGADFDPGLFPAGEELTTEFVYDTWGRLRQMTYPDGEVLSYGYDSGGLVRSATGVKLGAKYLYIERLEYDRFGQRAFEEKGNGIRTHYEYDPSTRRLGRLEAGEFQRLDYTYDLVGNVVGLTNEIEAGAIAPNGYGGRVTQTFAYDGLHRLVHAEGTWDEPGPSESSYALDLEYDVIHNLTHKTQSHVVTTPGGAEVTQRETTYDWAYAYPAAGSARPHAPTRVGSQLFEYDASGRMVTRRAEGRGPIRTMLWDSEDRIRAIQDGGETVTDEDGNVTGRGRTTEFVYDATGQRVFKRGAQGETAYVNQFYTLRNETVATKHVFVGASRVTSKLVPGEAHALPGETDELARFLGRWWEHRSEEAWDHARNVEMNPHYRVPSDIPSPMGLPESNFVYFYHPDHLGSTSFVTDGAGDIYEHVQYFPHGEVWADERSNTERIPYLFTGKEFDQETGLYDFGARMYDPRVGLWASPDPALAELIEESDLRGLNPASLAMYRYCSNSPLRFVDPDGRQDFDILEAWRRFQRSLADLVTSDDFEENYRRSTQPHMRRVGDNPWLLATGSIQNATPSVAGAIFATWALSVRAGPPRPTPGSPGASAPGAGAGAGAPLALTADNISALGGEVSSVSDLAVDAAAADRVLLGHYGDTGMIINGARVPVPQAGLQALEFLASRVGGRTLANLPGNMEAIAPALRAADEIIFNVGAGGIRAGTLTAQELLFIIDEGMIGKVKFVTGLTY